MKEKRKREAIVDSDYAEYEESLHDIHSSGYSKLEVRYIYLIFLVIYLFFLIRYHPCLLIKCLTMFS